VPLPPSSLPEPPSLSVRQRSGTKLLMALFLLAAVVGGAGGLIEVALGGGEEDRLDITPTTSRLPQRMVVLALCGLINAGCAVGMWSFRRWGVYGVVCASLIAFVVNWKLGGVPVALPGLIGVACVAVFATAIWVEFD
jgi:hypothetical protein